MLNSDDIVFTNLGFDADKYARLQSEQILDRIAKFTGKLYLEVGGKFIRDGHASRVLPWFDPHAKKNIFLKLKDKIEILFCVNAQSVIANKKLPYEKYSYLDTVAENLVLIEKLFGMKPIIVINKIDVNTHFDLILNFEKNYQKRGYKVMERYFIAGYPHNLDYVLSDDWFWQDDHIPVTKNLVLVTGPEADSGKLSTCIGQIYLDSTIGLQSGYAKYETFPIWNLDKSHPVNLAYEAATADIGDYNCVDKLHEEAYKQKAINYNRDIDAFLLLKDVAKKVLTHKNYINNYKSPTDMGINTAGFCITDDEVVCKASLDEIQRREKWYVDAKNQWIEYVDRDPVEKCQELYQKGLEYCEKRGYENND